LRLEGQEPFAEDSAARHEFLEIIGLRIADHPFGNECPTHGATLLRVTPGVFYSIIPLVCGPLMLFGGIAVALGVPGSRGMGILMLLFGFGLTAMGIRGTWEHAVLIELTEHGIMFHSNTGGVRICFALRKGLFIPWERLESIRFLTLRQLRDEGLLLVLGRGLVRPGCVGLKLRMDGLWPPPGTIREGIIMRRGKPGEIYFRTAECTPAGRQLWDEMTSIVKKHGIQVRVVEAEKMGDRKQ
jgi:hypothetical protein